MHDFIHEKGQITHIGGIEENVRRKAGDDLGAEKNFANPPLPPCSDESSKYLNNSPLTDFATFLGSLGISALSRELTC